VEISKSLLYTHQKYNLQTRNTQTKTWNEVQGYNVIKQVPDYNIRIFLNDEELDSGYFLSVNRETVLNFASDF